jgi:microcystin-dependent protein
MTTEFPFSNNILNTIIQPRIVLGTEGYDIKVDLGLTGTRISDIYVDTLHCLNYDPPIGGGTGGSGGQGPTGAAGATGANGITGPPGSLENLNGVPTQIVFFGNTGITSSSQLTFNGSEMVIPTTQLLSQNQAGRMRLANLGDDSYIQSGLRSVNGSGNILNITAFSSSSAITQFDTHNARVCLGGGFLPDINAQKIQIQGETLITGTTGGAPITTIQQFFTPGTTTLPQGNYNIYGWGEGGTGQGSQAGGFIQVTGFTGGNLSWGFAGGSTGLLGNNGGNGLFLNVGGLTGWAYGGGGGGGLTGSASNASNIGGTGGYFSSQSNEQLSFFGVSTPLSNVSFTAISGINTTYNQFINLNSGTIITCSTQPTIFSNFLTSPANDILTFPAGTAFSIQSTQISGNLQSVSASTSKFYAPYQNSNIGLSSSGVTGVLGDGQHIIIDGISGISGSNVEFELSLGSLYSNLQSNFSINGTITFSINTPTQFYFTNNYTYNPSNLTITINQNNFMFAPYAGLPLSLGFLTTENTIVSLSSINSISPISLRTLQTSISAIGNTGTLIQGGSGILNSVSGGGGGGGYYGGGGGVIGGRGGNGSGTTGGILNTILINGSDSDAYRNKYNNYVNGGSGQSGLLIIETISNQNLPVLQVDGTISARSVTATLPSSFNSNPGSSSAISLGGGNSLYSLLKGVGPGAGGISQDFLHLYRYGPSTARGNTFGYFGGSAEVLNISGIPVGSTFPLNSQNLLNIRSSEVVLDGNSNLTLNGALNGTTAVFSGSVTTQAGITSSGPVSINSSGSPLTIGGSVYSFPPVGSIIMYGAAAAPSGWLVCNGDPVPVQYTALIAIIGAYLPNFQSRIPLGFGQGPGLSSYSSMGGTGGVETVTLTTDQIPPHTHTLSPSPLIWYNPAGSGRGSDGNFFSTNGPTATDSTGGGQAHENRQPYLVVNFIIKY